MMSVYTKKIFKRLLINRCHNFNKKGHTEPTSSDKAAGDIFAITFQKTLHLQNKQNTYLKKSVIMIKLRYLGKKYPKDIYQKKKTTLA